VKRFRPVILNLTPLLDLLLIVIFAQYLDLQSTSTEVVREAKTSEQTTSKKLEETTARLRRVEADLRAAVAERDRLRSQMAEIDQEYVEQLKRRQEEIERQLEAVVKVVQQQLGVTEQAVERTLSSNSPQELKKILDELRRLRNQSTPALVRHLFLSAEFRKRWDVWEFHVHDDGSLELSVEEEVLKKDWFPQTPGEIVRELKQIDEPKSFILLMFSYGNATRKARERVTVALEPVRKTLSDHWGAGKHIYVAKVGYLRKPKK
jgi:archaellum component FlaC